MKITINEERLKKIIYEVIKQYINESKELSTLTYHGNILNVKHYDINEEEDKNFILLNIDKIWDILEKSYESLGGFKGFRNQKDMLKKCPFYRIGFSNGEIITVSVYNDYLGGNKCVGVGTIKDNRHKESVLLLDLILKYNIDNWNEWVWVEASDKVEEMCIKNEGFNLPSEYAFLYLGNKPYKNIDDYHYIRNIDGIPTKKTIFGFKDEQSFNILKQVINDKIEDFINRKSKNITEDKENLYQEYMSQFDEIYRYKEIIDYFVYLKDDEHINEFPEEALNVLYDAIKNIKQLLTEKQYEKRVAHNMNIAIEEGERVIKTSTIFAASYIK